MPISVLRVSQLNRYLHSLIEADSRLHEIYLRGEIANFVRYPSGHAYFSLREEAVSVRAVMFRSNAEQLRFQPENGMQVMVRGMVSLYERDGTCRILASEIVPAGAGERAVAMAQLRKKLEEEGLLDSARKRPLPAHPRVLGVVTSGQGAVLHDIISVLMRKAPDVCLLLAPASVQGDSAAKAMQEALAALNRDGRSEIILLARGGGSAENLDSFWNEALVRAVASSRIPVISAVGHETDLTLCDFAADCRAATPTAAAEIALGGLPDLPERISTRRTALAAAMEQGLREKTAAFAGQKERFAALSPKTMLAERGMLLAERQKALSSREEEIIHRGGEKLAHCAQSLEHLSPLGVLARGYTLTEHNGTAIRTVDAVRRGDILKTRLPDGILTSVVSAVEKEQHDDI